MIIQEIYILFLLYTVATITAVITNAIIHITLRIRCIPSSWIRNEGITISEFILPVTVLGLLDFFVFSLLFIANSSYNYAVVIKTTIVNQFLYV